MVRSCDHHSVVSGLIGGSPDHSPIRCAPSNSSAWQAARTAGQSRSAMKSALALHVVTLVAHECATILAQRQARAGDEVAALVRLLTEVPLTGWTISMDAGLLNAQTTQTITQHQGD